MQGMGLPGTDDSARLVGNGEALGRTDGALGEIRGSAGLGQTLLILHADRRQAETLNEPGHGDQHGALLEHLIAGQLGRRIGAEHKAHAARFVPGQALLAQRRRHLAHFDQQIRLGQSLKRHADVGQGLLRENAVDHAHAEGVEQADDFLVLENIAPNLGADDPGRRPHHRVRLVQRQQVCDVVLDPSGLQPRLESLDEERVVEGLGPQAGIGFVEAGQGSGHAQHADQTGPRAIEIGQQQHRTAVLHQARGQVVGVLPGSQQDDDRRLGIDAGENVAALALAADETMPLVRLDRMGPLEGDAKSVAQDVFQFRFEFLLDRPAIDVGRFAEIGIGDKQHLALFGAHAWLGFWKS